MLFAEEEVVLPNIDEFEKGQKLGMEKELLGFYLTEHPHAEKLSRMGDFVTHRIADLYAENCNGKKVTVGGIVEACRVVMTKLITNQCALPNFQILVKVSRWLFSPRPMLPQLVVGKWIAWF